MSMSSTFGYYAGRGSVDILSYVCTLSVGGMHNGGSRVSQVCRGGAAHWSGRAASLSEQIFETIVYPASAAGGAVSDIGICQDARQTLAQAREPLGNHDAILQEQASDLID
jgi:hypothetical protein